MTEASRFMLESYPREIGVGGRRTATLRLMEKSDRDRVLDFARSLPPDDLLFLRKDITAFQVVDEWLRDIEAGHTITVLAEADGELVGYGSLLRDESSEPTDEPVAELVSQSLLATGRSLTKDGIELELNIPDELTVRVRPAEFKQVLDNLLLNARAALLAAEKFYEIDDINDDTYELLSERMQQANTPGIYERVLADTYDTCFEPNMLCAVRDPDEVVYITGHKPGPTCVTPKKPDEEEQA